ncbi:MAG: BCCT family transporter [Pseudomonadota bacterium]
MDGVRRRRRNDTILRRYAVVSTLFGLATSLGFGTQQAASGLNFLFGISDGMTTQFGIIIGITGLAILSVIRGLDGGIKLLSNINMVFAALLFLFVFIAGPTLLIFTGFGVNTVNYLLDFVPLSNWVGREDITWYHGWTIFYWAWWVSWAPFVGMFIARVSKGRTIREFILAVMFVPVMVMILWFTTFGNTAIYQLQQQMGQLANGFGDNSSMILFYVLENLPLTEITVAFSIILILIFFVTSADSGSLVLDTITAGGKIDAPMPQRIFWACMIGAVAAILLFGGGDSVLGSLQAGTITAALPFTFVLLACCASLYKGLQDEYRTLSKAA